MIVVLAGGVGAARFLRGVVRAVPPQDVTVVSNTGDDLRVYGVHVSPDADIVTHTLAGIDDAARGWGIEGDTTVLMDELRALGVDTWFTLGDRDYAHSLARTILLDRGVALSECAARLARSLGVATTILPMTDDPVATRVVVRDESGTQRDLHFQDYWVRRRAADPVVSVRLEGSDVARPAPGVIEAILRAEAVLVAPSNPVVSIGTILQVPGIREALRACGAPVVGVSPIVGGAVVRGMADRLLPSAGAEVTAPGVAGLYRDFLDGFVIDTQDAALESGVRELGVAVEVAQTVMRGVEESTALAKTALALATRIRERLPQAWREHADPRLVACADAWVAGLRGILGDDLVAVWTYGASTFRGSHRMVADLDAHVVVRRDLDERALASLDALDERMRAEHPPFGGEIDAWVVTDAETRGAEPPRTQRGRRIPDEAWPLHRAHWRAGHVVTLYGSPPAVLEPGSAEIARGLDFEAAYVERHLGEAWSDAYTVLNTCRILLGREHGVVVCSKRGAAAWASVRLDRRWRPLIEAALRAYAHEATDADRARLREGAPRMWDALRERAVGP